MTLSMAMALNLHVTMTDVTPRPLTGVVGRDGRRANERLSQQQGNCRPRAETGAAFPL